MKPVQGRRLSNNRASDPPAERRPEQELLLCAARVRMDAATAERMSALLGDPLDWAYLLGAARHHGLLPLLHWHLNESCSQSAPESVLQELHQGFVGNVQKNLILTDELLKILDAFQAQRIRLLPLKGPILATSVYGNLALREFCDLDVLVHKQDVARAKEVLVSLGYRDELRLSKVQEAAYLDSHYDYAFRSEDRQRLVELHWGITPGYFSFTLDFERLWDNRDTTYLGGREIPTFRAEDYLLLLAVHGCKHLWKQLSWVVDVAELVRVAPEIAWPHVIEQSEQLHLRRALLLAVLLAHDLLEASVPDEVLKLARSDRKAGKLYRQVRQKLFSDANGPLGIVENTLFQLRAKERFVDRVRFCFGMAVSMHADDLEGVSFPRSLFFLHYPSRAFRLIKKYAFGPLFQ